MNDFFLKFAAPFVKATKETFSTMMETEVTLHSPKFKKDSQAKGDISALIGLTGTISRNGKVEPFRGLLVLSFREETYLKLVSRMLGEDITEYTPEISDAGAEMANIILGASKPGLNQLGITPDMTSPSVIKGKSHEITYPKDGITVETVLSCDVGDFYLDLCCQDLK